MSKTIKLTLVGLSLLSLVFNLATVLLRVGGQRFSDFAIFYTGAQILKDGNAGDLYNLALQANYQQNIGFTSVFFPDGPLPYNHPAYELLLFLPFTYLSFAHAYHLWLLILSALWVTSCKFLSSLLPDEQRGISFVVLLSFTPAWIAILRAQDSIVSLLLFLGVYLSLKVGRDLRAGCFLALGLYKPQLVLPLAMLFAIKGRWRFLYGFISVGAFLVCLSVFITGWDGAIEYVGLLRWLNENHYTMFPKHMANVHGFVEAIVGLNHPGTIASLLMVAISVSLMAWCLSLWKGPWAPNAPLFELQFSHLIIITLLVGYHAYAYDLTLLSLAAVLATRYALAVQRVTFMWLLVFGFSVFIFPLGLHIVDDNGLVWIVFLIFLCAAVTSREMYIARATNAA